MALFHPKWVKDVDVYNCRHSGFVKNGRTIYGRQRYKCKDCNRTFVRSYTNQAYQRDTNVNITNLLKEGVGIRGTSRLLCISKTTITRRILQIAEKIEKPRVQPHRTYELDELQTYIGKKENRIWIAYILDRGTRKVIDFNIGLRNNKMFSPVVKTILTSDAKRIYTDKLINYRYLLPENIHITKLGSGPKMLIL